MDKNYENCAKRKYLSTIKYGNNNERILMNMW